MKKVKFDCNGNSSPAYSCSEPGDNSGEYVKAEEAEQLLAALAAEVDRLKADVARYQFLRNGASGDLGMDDQFEIAGYVDQVFCCVEVGSRESCTGDELDSVIDSEIARLEAAKTGDANA